MSDIVFRRINGRIVPIKKKGAQSDPLKKLSNLKRRKVTKDDVKSASVKGIFGAGLSAGSISYASKILKKSNKAFRESATTRAASKLVVGTGGNVKNKLIRESAKSFIKGKSLSFKSKAVLAVGTGAASVLFGSAATDITPFEDIGDEVGNIFGAATVAGASLFFGRKFKIKGARSVQDVFSGYAKRGQAMTSAKIRNIAKTAYDPRRVKKGTQFDLGF